MFGSATTAFSLYKAFDEEEKKYNPKLEGTV